MRAHVNGLLVIQMKKAFYFCGRSSLKDFSYCKLHLLYAYQYQTKGKKDKDTDKDEIPEFIEKNTISLANNLILNIFFKSIFFC